MTVPRAIKAIDVAGMFTGATLSATSWVLNEWRTRALVGLVPAVIVDLMLRPIIPTEHTAI
jgi:hypothetical protein